MTTQEDDRALAPRRAALAALDAALKRRGGLDEALSSGAFSGLAGLDRAFARALVMAALRRLGPIDRLLDTRLKSEPPPPVRGILRLGLAQLFVLSTPEFAAVDTSVALAPKPLRGLVNAVLRGLIRDKAQLSAAPADHVPPWLLARWIQAHGEVAAFRIAALVADEPATDITPYTPAEAAGIAAALEGEVLATGSVRTRLGGDIAGWPGYGTGRWWVQDAAAAIPARLFDLQPGEKAVDLCAAPGGKTLQMAAADAFVTAVDRSAGRLARVTEGLKRTGLTAETVIADAAAWDPARTFDAVLLDAPCSATGTFRRHPDVLWNARASDIPRLAAGQSRLLDAAAARTAPGGRLVYSVCSLEPEEGEGQVGGFLARNPSFVLDPIAPGEGGAPPASLAAPGVLRILPTHLAGGLDGFFVARFRRGA